MSHFYTGAKIIFSDCFDRMSHNKYSYIYIILNAHGGATQQVKIK